MSKKVAVQICKLQDIKNPQTYVRIKCPYCNNKTMFIGLNNNKGVCSICNKERTEEEILRLTEEDYLEKNKGLEWMMKSKEGVDL